MTGNNDGATATGGLRGITEDTPDQAGVPGEAGSIDGVSAAGAPPETYDVSGNAGDTRGTGESTELEAGGPETESDEDLVSGDTGGVTGTSDL
ncbi:hypothetical protein [Deinococcus apachensis]|uniref:hypothetical protein n=1 Tax=Deinococcus apachensis TaxID=309886 RepID=UPI0003671A89|nr:hypothetical protein [Deinococcus apachensis]